MRGEPPSDSVYRDLEGGQTYFSILNHAIADLEMKKSIKTIDASVDPADGALPGCGKRQNAVILSPPWRAKNPSYAFVLNQERFFASLRMTTKRTFPASC
jgi:hypothetical protein